MGVSLPFALLLVVLLFRELALLALIAWGGIGLGPDEAQYWTWSQLLDWGYYSKPPGIAWQIWLGTQLFGNTELGVRFIAGLFGILLSLAVYGLALACQLSPWISFWAALGMSFAPLGVLGSLFAITDGGMLLFWTMAAIVIVSAISQNKTPHYYLLGILILLGALFKWPIYLFWGLILLSLPFYPTLRSWHLIPGMLISLLGLIPSIIWNSSHQWVTFRHVWATITGTAAAGEVLPATGNPLSFLGSQAGLVSPILFLLLLLGFGQMLLRPYSFSPALRLCGGWSLLLLGSCFILSFFQKIQGNWCVIAYPTAFPFLAAYASHFLKTGKQWLIAGTALSALLCALLLGIPSLQENAIFKALPIPYRLNLFRHNVGWHRLYQVLEKIGYDPQTQFLVADTYQTTSLLSFYGPKQNRAYFLNLRSVRKNQFSFWPGLKEERLGQSGYFVLVENLASDVPEWAEKKREYKMLLHPYFREVRALGTFPLFASYGQAVKSALIFACEDYLGGAPPDPERY